MTCGLCTDSKHALVKTKDSATTNLFSHLRHHHLAKYAEIASVTLPRSTPTSKQTKKRDPSQPTIQQAVDRAVPYAQDSDKYKQLLKSVTRYIVSGIVIFTHIFHFPIQNISRLLKNCDIITVIIASNGGLYNFIISRILDIAVQSESTTRLTLHAR